MRKFLWIIAFIAFVLAGWYYIHSRKSDGDDGQAQNAQGGNGSGKHAGGGKNATVPVGVATAKAGTISVYLDGLGNITPTATVTVHTLVNGQLMNLFFTEGQTVKKNDLLAAIDDRPFKAALEQAEGLLTRDEALLAEAKLDLKRYQDLWSQDSIARQQLDAQSSLVKQYDGAVKNDQGQVDAAKVNLIYTKITSPVTGRVGLRQVDVGNIVHTTDTNGIVIVTELQPITALFTLPEDNIPSVFKLTNAGTKLEADAWDRDNKIKLAAGQLIAIDNQVDPSTGTVKFRAEFANDDNALFPSQFVNIRLKLSTLADILTIPTSGVQRGTHGTFAYLVKPDKTVAVRNITLGPAEGDSVAVQAGLKAGDQVVVDGTDALREGSKVEIASLDGKSAAKPPGDDGSDKEKADATPDKGDAALRGQAMGKSEGTHYHKHKKNAADAESNP